MEPKFTGPAYTVGIEEELMILDPDSYALVNAIDDLVEGSPNGDIKPRALSKAGEPFRTSGLRLTLGKDGTVNGLAYLRNNGGHYEDIYIKTPQGWRIKERKYFKP